MAGGVTLAVRQIGSYPALGASDGGEEVLVQPGGLGNPYATLTTAKLVGSALIDGGGPLAVGYQPPADVGAAQVLTGVHAILNGSIIFDGYQTADNQIMPWGAPPVGTMSIAGGDFLWQLGAGQGGPAVLSEVMTLSMTGALGLPNGTLTVARDPGAAMEVATAGWVGNNTVASFNGRRGVVQLTSADIYGALCLDSSIATQNWVNSQIQASITMLLANHPFVFGWNGRTGAVYLTLADISCVFFQPGQQPITQTPPLTSNDYSIPNTAWVVEYIANEFAGGGGNLATQSWVLANTVNSFNGRMGPVTLTSSDVYDVGAAPLNSPAFSGIPTAPTAAVGQATGQIATTAFVQQAITNNTAGVSTFNTRTGDVVLETADVIAVGGLTNPSPNLTGNPTCPTQPPGTNLPLIANCEFVQAAIAAGTVTSFNTRTGAVTLTLADVTGVGGAPLVSPAFSSVPTAPTAAPGTNTVQLATTAFVTAAVTAAGGVSSFNSRTGAVTLTANDVSAVGALVNPSVSLTGSPTATTATAGDNSQRIATTAFVQTALSAGAVSSFNTRTGAVTLQGADITAAGGAILASPAFTGAPTAPTATAGTNNTQIATTAYVTAAILADTTGVTSFNTRTGAISLLLADITGAGGAPLASPSFTGVPLGPTATAGTSTTQLATTAFVQAAIASSGVASFNSRTGAVTLIANDVSAAGGALVASPTFTGVPAGPTAAPGTNTTQLATTAFVAAALGGYLPLSGGTLTGALTGTTLTLSGGGGTGTALSAPNGGAGFGSTVTAPSHAITGTSAALTTASGAPVLIFAPSNYIEYIASTPQISFYAGGNPTLVVGGGTGFPVTVSGQGICYSIYNAGANVALQWTAALTLHALVNNSDLGAIQFVASDAALKENFAPLAVDPLAVLGQVPLQQFDWKPTPLGQKPHASCGFTAQDLQPLIPEAVNSGETMSVDLLPLLAYCIGAIQQLSARISALDGKSA